MDAISSVIDPNFEATKKKRTGVQARVRCGYSVEKAFVILKHEITGEPFVVDWAETEQDADKKVQGLYETEQSEKEEKCQLNSKTCQKKCKKKS